MTIKWRGTSSETNAPVPTGRAQGEIYPPGTKTPLDLADNNESALDYVRNARKKMGMLARMQFDRSTQKELQRIAGGIAVDYLGAQKEVMLAKIVAGVGIAQREIFKIFLSQAIEQDKDLLERTNRAQKEMTNMVERETLVVIKEKKEKIDEAKTEFDAGKILEDDYKNLCDIYNQTAEKMIVDKFERMDKVTQAYLEHFEQAVKKYREKAVQIGAITG
jgi:hypothetical protein